MKETKVMNSKDQKEVVKSSIGFAETEKQSVADHNASSKK